MPLSRCLVFLWIFTLVGSTALAVNKPGATKPAINVIVITIDTLRPDHLGCYGYKQIHTPNIDALATDGVRFERAYTSVPVTLPSHTVIFTGTYPTYSGMHDFAGNKLGSSQPTLASALKSHGYTTGAVVASAALDSRFGLNRGFDFYYDHFDFNRMQESNIEEMERPGNIVADITLDWLKNNYQKKFFFWMHLYDPHYPYRPPAPYDAEYKDHLYDGEIAFADEQVGKLVRFLKDKNLYRTTLILVAGDHGESLGEHGEKTHGFFIYNATLHVPLIFHLPASETARTRTPKTLVNLADLMPTILQLLHLKIPSDVEGQSLVPVLEGKSEAERSLYAETFLARLHFNWSELRSVETERYHYIDAPKPELYDLSTDPREVQNIFAQKPAVTQELSTRLKSLIAQYTAGEEQAQKTGLDPALMERLKSLGYAGFSGGGSPEVSNHDLPDPKDRIQIYQLFSDAMSDSQHARYEQSVEKLTTVLQTDPDSIPAHYILGLDYYRMQQFPLAVEHLQRVMHLSPEYALACYQLGLAYARAGDMDNAEQTLKRTLQLDPTNYDAAFNLGAVYLQKKMVPEAASAFRQAIAINSDYAPAHRALGEVLLYEQQVDDALAELRRAEKLQPEDPATHAALAKALATKGLNEQAQEEMRRAQQVQPQP
jgi:arylsulfatase A-like enzyme/Flp pilus assembly protein TadD